VSWPEEIGHFVALCVNTVYQKRYEICPKLPFMTNKKLHMCFRLAPSVPRITDTVYEGTLNTAHSLTHQVLVTMDDHEVRIFSECGRSGRQQLAKRIV